MTLEEALAAYQEAALLAPQDTAIVERARRCAQAGACPT